MLVLSRRETEKVLFPCLGMSVEVARVRGKTVRLGIDAPDHVRIIRSELAVEERRKPLPKSNVNGFRSNGATVNVATTNAQIRENLESAKLAIRLAQNQLRQRLNDHAAKASPTRSVASKYGTDAFIGRFDRSRFRTRRVDGSRISSQVPRRLQTPRSDERWR